MGTWGIGKDGCGGGSTNHAWSGGDLTILAQYVCGIYPLEPGWKTFVVKPQLGSLDYAETGNETIAGRVAVKVSRVKMGTEMELSVPGGSEAVVFVPSKNKKVIIDGKKVSSKENEGDYTLYRIAKGNHFISAR